MPVDSTSRLYDSALKDWEIMADVLGGTDTVKAAGAKYLPFFEEQESEDYAKYLSRADFFNATGRTREAIIGFLFRKDPDPKVPETEGMKAFLADATLTGKSFYDVAKEVAEESIGKGRYVSVVEWDDNENRPFVRNYAPEDVINWHYTRRNGKMTLTMLMLHEMDPEFHDMGDGAKAADEYQLASYDQWREWRLNEDVDGNGYVMCTVWRRKKTRIGTSTDLGRTFGKVGTGPAPGVGIPGSTTSKQNDFVPVATHQPVRFNQPLNDIPAVCHSPTGPMWDEVCRPPLRDLADINLSLYRTSADLENARHVLGVPTPWAAGFTTNQDETLTLGSSRAWVTSEVNAKCGFLELVGNLQALKDAVEEKERRMAAFGARMVDTQATANGPETYGAVALRQTGETSVLMRLSLSLTQSLTDVVAWAYWWTSNQTETPQDAETVCSYTLNTDFLSEPMDGPTATALMSLYLQRAISFETLFDRLQAGEIVPASRTLEEEKRLIEAGESLLLGSAGQAALDETAANVEAARSGIKAKSGEDEPTGKQRDKPGNEGEIDAEE